MTRARAGPLVGPQPHERRLSADLASSIAATFGFPGPNAMLMLALAGFAGGLVRGFTGFGFAMVFVPIATVAVGPVAAAGLLWVIDFPFAWMLAVSSWRRVAWRSLMPLLVGSILFVPIGVLILTRADPLASRWIVVASILLGVTALATGWRYHGRPNAGLSFGVGGMAGIASGLAQMGGLPIAIFWLAAQTLDARQVRDNLNGFFALLPTAAGIAYLWTGVINAGTVWQAVPLLLPYGVGLGIGTLLFPIASERTFRRIAYAVIALAALLALPLLDAWLGR